MKMPPGFALRDTQEKRQAGLRAYELVSTNICTGLAKSPSHVF